MNAATLGTIEEFDAQFDAENPVTTTPAVDADAAHIERVVAAAEQFVAVNYRWLNAHDRRELVEYPPPKVKDALAKMFATFAERQVKSWPRVSWPFLIVFRHIAAEIQTVANCWNEDHERWPGQIFVSDELDKSLMLYRYPAPPPEPRITALEPLDQLLKLHVKRDQLQRMVGWLTPEGKPDFARVDRAIAGTEEWPTHLDLPPLPDNLPTVQPSLGLIADIGELAAAALAAE